MFVFRYLLVLVATLESFAHGANDTANATAPVAAQFNVYDNGFDGCSNRETPVWIMAIAGCFVYLGIIFQGAPVMETIGKRIAHMDMHRGFAMELSSTVTVVIATLLKLPVSTTHCEVGSVVFVSLANPGWRKMSFPMVGKIVLSWLLTVPTTGAVAAFLTMIFRSYLRN
ncbi:Sodium-dependent phosphate transporter 1 [Phytophthora citrophthora]|uniref:Sodium-dependent phosphate transporter 1 n=1 Tax=Phytophthora citrophthora TaxID=4793 RepID=A0AAD9G1V8_9STRA|nr:Sodium-dependent phosphate transporter 1 [Phytophthora citrophthora]